MSVVKCPGCHGPMKFVGRVAKAPPDGRFSEEFWRCTECWRHVKKREKRGDT